MLKKFEYLKRATIVITSVFIALTVVINKAAVVYVRRYLSCESSLQKKARNLNPIVDIGWRSCAEICYLERIFFFNRYHAESTERFFKQQLNLWEVSLICFIFHFFFLFDGYRILQYINYKLCIVIDVRCRIF